MSDENETFYMRVHGPAEYRCHGADMGTIVARGRCYFDVTVVHSEHGVEMILNMSIGVAAIVE